AGLARGHLRRAAILVLAVTATESMPVAWHVARYRVLLLQCLLVVCLVPLPLIAHEAGHLLGGWLVGFRFHYVNLGPVTIRRHADRIRFSPMKDRESPFGGACSLATDDRDLARREAIMVAMGPVASLLLA